MSERAENTPCGPAVSGLACGLRSSLGQPDVIRFEGKLSQTAQYLRLL